MKHLGRLTIYFRANNVSDAVEAAVVRKKRKAAKMQAKAKAQAKKMNAVDIALETTLCDTSTALNGEIASFGASKMSLLTFLQDQYRSRLLLQNGLYKTIPTLGISHEKKTLQASYAAACCARRSKKRKLTSKSLTSHVFFM
jgi:hypothetical protein